MRAFFAQICASDTETDGVLTPNDAVKCVISGTQLVFLETVWPIADIELSETQGQLCLRYRHATLQTSQWKCLNGLMPYLSVSQRKVAEDLLQTQSSASGSRLVFVLLATILVIGGVIALFFMGQIELRQQQLAVTSEDVSKTLGQKHRDTLIKSGYRCTSPEWDAPLLRVLKYYQKLTGSTGIQHMYVMGTVFPQSLMLSDGTFAISAGMLRDLDASALLALMAHQEGHLQGRHRLESRIYEQGNQVFSRLWKTSQQISDRDYLLEAPLWVNYSRGQEAAADQWALQHLKGQQQGHLKSLAKVWSTYIQSSAKLPRFMERHPLATDRLQQIDQLSDAPVLPGYLQETVGSLQQQAGYCTQN